VLPSSCVLGVVVSFLVLLRAADAVTLGLGTALGVMLVKALSALNCFQLGN
jgi:hypothetical protein